jgi:hypothetical protein
MAPQGLIADRIGNAAALEESAFERLGRRLFIFRSIASNRNERVASSDNV